MRKIEPLHGVEGVVAGGIALVNIPVNRRYHAIKIFAGANDSEGDPLASVESVVDYVRVIINGVVFRDLTAVNYRKIARLNGMTVATNEIPLYFSEPWRASITGEESTSWDLSGVVKATIEIKLKSGIVSPSVKVQAVSDFGRNTTLGTDGQLVPFTAAVKQLTLTYSANQGVFDITTLPIGSPIQRIHFLTSSGTISSVEVIRDGEKVHEATIAENTRFLADYGIAAAEFTYPLIFDFEQQISSPLIVSRDLLVRPTLSANATLTAIVESRSNRWA